MVRIEQIEVLPNPVRTGEKKDNCNAAGRI